MKISVGELLDTIQKEEKGLQYISEMLGFSMSAITDRLRELHYSYDGMEDTWIWKGVESENRDIPFTIETPKQVYSREIQPLNLSLFKNSNEQHKPSPKTLTKDKLFKRNEEELMKTISEAINHQPNKPTTPKKDIGGKTEMLELTETNMFDSLKGIPTMTNLETKTVLVKDVMITLNNSLNTKEAAKKIGVGAKRLSKRLKELGYAFHQSSKSWEYEGEGQEPMNEVFIELKPIQTSLGLLGKEESQEIKQTDTFTLSQKEEVDTKTKESQEHINHVLLNEIQSIKDMLYHKDDKEAVEVIVENSKSFTPNDLFAKILELEQGEKTRKTLVIDKKIGEKLDTFADKYKRKVNKSDILEIALLDFFAKYPLPE